MFPEPVTVAVTLPRVTVAVRVLVVVALLEPLKDR
jgi:hypothetical protein